MVRRFATRLLVRRHLRLGLAALTGPLRVLAVKT
jgi:hypothetical protein